MSAGHTLTTDQADEIEEAADITLTRYSGRAMYGEQCAALVGDLRDLMRFAMACQRVLGEDLATDLARLVRRDDMGLDSVYYFPGVQVAGWPRPGWTDDA